MEKICIKEIKACEKDKILQLKEIEVEAFGDGAVDEWVLIPIARYGKIYSLNLEEQIVSVVEMLKIWGKDEAYIYSFATRKKYRGKGYGKTLLAEVLEMLGKEGIKKVSLTVAPDNQAAINLYSSFGFEKIDLLEDEYGKGIHRLKMEKKLIMDN